MTSPASASACAAPEQAVTDRLALALVVGAGIVSAFQVGKAPLAMEAIRADLGLDLAAASWVLSAFALMGAMASLPIGAVSDRFEARRAIIAGLAMQATGSALGALADGLPWLLAARALEGLGFLAVTVAAPALVVAVTGPAGRKRAFAAWATFMPVGMAVIMFAAPIVGALGWRGIWWANAVLLAGYAAAFVVGTRGIRAGANRLVRGGVLRGVGRTLRSAGAWFLAGQFCAYTAVFFALFGFLPTILGERLMVGQGTAGVLSALAVVAGAAGCLACGALLQRGVPASRLLALGFSTLAVCGAGILVMPLPGSVAYAACVVFSFVGAFIPVVIFDAAPRVSARPETIGSVVGLATQGNSAGIVLGPAAAGAIAGSLGWAWVAVPVVAVAMLAAVSAHAFRGAGIGAAGPGRSRARGEDSPQGARAGKPGPARGPSRRQVRPGPGSERRA